MLKRALLLVCTALFLVTYAVGQKATSPKEKFDDPFANPRRINFNADWRFLKGDATGAEQPAFDDSKWRKLDLPHDFLCQVEFQTPLKGPVLEDRYTNGLVVGVVIGPGCVAEDAEIPALSAGRQQRDQPPERRRHPGPTRRWFRER